jgi:uncharacterized protein with HEPN domain
MPSDKTRLALYDIRDNARLAGEFVGRISLDAFKNNRLVFYGVTRALEIISEAVRRLPAELRDRHPELPWRAIMGVGNIYRHNYDNVVESFVWRTVHESLPSLVAVIDLEITRLDEGT